MYSVYKVDYRGAAAPKKRVRAPTFHEPGPKVDLLSQMLISLN